MKIRSIADSLHRGRCPSRAV